MVLTTEWTNTIDLALKNPHWDDYDSTIQTEVSSYATRFRLNADWHIFKAQVWTETGAAKPAWKTRPMQVGNAGDPAYATLKAGAENSSLIMSTQIKQDLARGRHIDDGNFNIQLGMAYAYTKLSTFASVVIDQRKLTYEVKAGDSLDKIAKAVGTTVQNLVALNSGVSVIIRPKQKLIYQKAAIQPSGCNVTAETLQNKYNGNGDSHYAEKIKYCLVVIGKLKR